MKPLATLLCCAIALMTVAPLALFIEIKLAGREAIAGTLPIIGIAVAMLLSAAAEVFTMKALAKAKATVQIKFIMLCKALRFLLAALLLIAYGILSDGDARLFAINLIVCYFAVTTVLTLSYTRRPQAPRPDNETEAEKK